MRHTFPFLAVDDFLGDVVSARALTTAFEVGLIDALAAQPRSAAELAALLKFDARGLRLLLDLLTVNGVVEQQDGGVALASAFQSVLPYRDLLEAKLDFANLVAPDVLERFTALLNDPAGFQRDSRIFNLFGYQHSVEQTPENYRRTQAWVRFTTALTRYEAQACLRHYDFSRARRMLDIGGNSGEFVLQVCRAHSQLQATVFDLPVVCDVGEDHVRGQPEASRITFVRGNALKDPLPAGFDVVSFKSMLHDWPEMEAKRFLTRASQALDPGGTLLIFERAPLEGFTTPLSYSLVPMLLFFRSFRTPESYREHLEAIGFRDVTVQTVPLEMPFFLVTATLASVAA
jgi:ubiquinone/menaquinone biosynthesis C-methylase UbiE